MGKEIKRVAVKYGTSEELAEIFRVCTGTGHNAISGKRNSERDRLIRDELVSQGAVFVPKKELPKKRNHNRLTSERLIRLLTLTHRIDDATLRNEIVEQLMEGGVL